MPKITSSLVIELKLNLGLKLCFVQLKTIYYAAFTMQQIKPLGRGVRTMVLGSWSGENRSAYISFAPEESRQCLVGKKLIKTSCIKLRVLLTLHSPLSAGFFPDTFNFAQKKIRKGMVERIMELFTALWKCRCWKDQAHFFHVHDFFSLPLSTFCQR